MNKQNSEETSIFDEVKILFLYFILVCVLLFLGSGCRTTTAKTYYENGQIKSEYQSSGFIPWSNGVGKNLPLSHINVSALNTAP